MSGNSCTDALETNSIVKNPLLNDFDQIFLMKITTDNLVLLMVYCLCLRIYGRICNNFQNFLCKLRLITLPAYMEMRNFFQTQPWNFSFSRSGLLYRMNSKSKILTIFGIKSTEQIFSGIQCCDELRLFVNVLVSIIFHVTVKYVFQGSYCTFSKCSLSLTNSRVKRYSFSFA